MTADHLDDFAYEPARDRDSEAMRRHYWAVAIGLQNVDGLEVSPYLRDVANAHIDGAQTLQETGELVRAHHGAGADKDHEEADLVCQRIAELLSRAPFYLAPSFLSEIHRYLFQDLDEASYHPGEYKSERVIKQEDVLNGDSVLYADPLTYDMALQGAFSAEQAKAYSRLEGDELDGFCHSLAFLWQIHPFHEGNTRTVAVFAELYLRHLGFDVSNEPFEQHARYFRDALVRAMYRNASANIFPDRSYLVRFFENVLGIANNTLDREDLVCAALFDDPTLLRNIDPRDALSVRA